METFRLLDDFYFLKYTLLIDQNPAYLYALLLKYDSFDQFNSFWYA